MLYTNCIINVTRWVMKKEKLLELIKYIKEKDLIDKYNDVYKEYD